MLDYFLPKMGGAEVSPRMNNIDPEARVLLATGHGTSDEVQKLLDPGRGAVEAICDQGADSGVGEGDGVIKTCIGEETVDRVPGDSSHGDLFSFPDRDEFRVPKAREGPLLWRRRIWMALPTHPPS